MSAPETSATPSLTLGAVLGTPVLFFPVPTPWPMLPGCDNNIYRQDSNGLIIAYDPIYPAIISSEAQSYFRPEQASSWSQSDSVTPSTALGPTFVCPKSWRAVQTTTIHEDATAQIQYTYCCPPGFALHTTYPATARSVDQCVSIVPPGGVIEMVSLTFVSTGTAKRATTYTVASTTATVNAPPVNGYSIVQKQATGTTIPGATPPPAGDTTEGQSGGLSGGAIAGIVVGAIAAILLVGFAIFWKFLRKQRYQEANQLSVLPSSSPSPPPSALPGKAELVGGQVHVNKVDPGVVVPVHKPADELGVQEHVEVDGSKDSQPRPAYEML